MLGDDSQNAARRAAIYDDGLTGTPGAGCDIAITPDGRGFILIRESDRQTGPREMEVSSMDPRH